MSAETSSTTYNSNVSQESTTPNSSKRIAWWILACAAVATVIVGAAVWGRRKVRDRHLLEGSVKRRMNLFSKFADNALCDAVGCGDAVEMTSDEKDDQKYNRLT